MTNLEAPTLVSRLLYSFRRGFLLFTLPVLFEQQASAVSEPALLRVGVTEEPKTLNWLEARSQADRTIAPFLVRSLLKLDRRGDLICDLCTEFHFESETDGSAIVRATLQESVRWTDGSALVAKNFVDAFETLKTVKPPWTTWNELYRSATASSPKNLEIRITKPNRSFLYWLTLPVSAPIRSRTSKGSDISFGQNVIGPFLVAEWQRGKRIVLEANPSHASARPVYRIEFWIAPKDKLLTMFRKGRIDVYPDPTTLEIMDKSAAKVQVNALLSLRWLVFNHRTPLLQEAGLRRAITRVLPREELAGVLKTGDRSSAGFIPPGVQGFHRTSPLSRDLDQARSERFRTFRTKEPLKLGLTFREDMVSREIAEWTRNELANIQIEVLLKPRSEKDLKEDLDARQFDLALTTFNFQTMDPLELLSMFQSQSPLNLPGVKNVRIDTLLTQLYRETDLTKREALLGDLLTALEVDEAVSFPLTYPAQGFLLGSRVKSFPATPFGNPDWTQVQLTP